MIRFDYLWYEFEFSQGFISSGVKRAPRREFFFLPERVLPDCFYTTKSVEDTFERADFRPYRILRDNKGQWIEKVLSIIRDTPNPRSSTTRPTRSATSQSITDGNTLDAVIAMNSLKPQKSSVKKFGKQLYTEVLKNRHQYFFDHITAQCAHR